MPSSSRREGSRELLIHVGETVGKRGKRMWEGFSDFVLQDNVLEVAAGLMYEFQFLCCLFTHLSIFFLFLFVFSILFHHISPFPFSFERKAK